MKLLIGIVVAWLLLEWYLDWIGGPIISVILLVLVGAIALAVKFHRP
jgi:hypothetical protein